MCLVPLFLRLTLTGGWPTGCALAPPLGLMSRIHNANGARKGVRMYRIEHKGPRRLQRVVSQDGISAAEFAELARDLGTQPRKARKTGRVAARQARRSEHVVTHWNGKETENSAATGDWIVTALAEDGSPLTDDAGHLNTYVVRADRFAGLYAPVQDTSATPHGAIFEARGVVKALRVEGGFEIKAPWGEMQRADDGWLLLSGPEVYGNHRDTFAQSYALLD